MNVTGPLRTLIAADTTANALLAGRVYAGVLMQQTEYPAAAINIVDDTPHNTKTAASDLDRVLVQVDVYGNTYASAAAVSAAIRAAIDYQTSGDLAHIEFKRSLDMYSDVAEKYRKVSEYSIMIKI